jgi:S-methylmethionine-dependent homocysteine/selenocysteine methylase
MTTAYQRIRGRLEGREPVLLDGPMGSELVRRGVRWRKHGLLTDTDAVLRLHEEYLASGAQVLRTNTFQLNPRVYLNVFRSAEHMRHIGAPGLETLVPRLIETSVQLACEARRKARREVEVPIFHRAKTWLGASTRRRPRFSPRRASIFSSPKA